MELYFDGWIGVTEQELEDAGNSFIQAVQNAIGQTGAICELAINQDGARSLDEV
jgi:hypothetical protein